MIPTPSKSTARTQNQPKTINRLRIFEDILKCKWSTSILLGLDSGIKQPGRLHRSIPGLTKKVMYERLKKLERYGLIERRLVKEKPLEVHYKPTAFGKKIIKILKLVQKL